MKSFIVWNNFCVPIPVQDFEVFAKFKKKSKFDLPRNERKKDPTLNDQSMATKVRSTCQATEVRRGRACMDPKGYSANRSGSRGRAL